MRKFIKELNEGEIHFRDNLQFELKSEFSPPADVGSYKHSQEFYIFVPNALDINLDNFPKNEFYRNQTNLIRYKTPEFKVSELIDETNDNSPMNRIPKISNGVELEGELKLLGNILRSSLRQEVRSYVKKLLKAKKEEWDTIISSISKWVKEIEILRSRYLIIQEDFLSAEMQLCPKYVFDYVDEFMSNSIDYYLTGLLANLRYKSDPLFDALDEQICQLLITEHLHREDDLKVSIITKDKKLAPEYVLYRRGLLSKFVLDALLLDVNRTDVSQRWGNLAGGTAAGIAMFVYFSLFVWQGSIFVINSLPFIVITTLLYILKDRMKEWLRTYFFKRAYRLFPDFTTKIKSPDGTQKIGRVKESVSILSPNRLPKEISDIRNTQFHTELEKFKRPESILSYKMSVKLYNKQPHHYPKRRFELNNIFRFNIMEFLRKASNPSQDFFVLDPETKELKRKRLPKVYHINIILKNTYPIEGGDMVSQLKKYRLIIDKNGIKRVMLLP